MADLIWLGLIGLIGAAFVVGHWLGMEDMRRINQEYGADHTYTSECWCHRPFQSRCGVVSRSGDADA